MKETECVDRRWACHRSFFLSSLTTISVAAGCSVRRRLVRITPAPVDAINPIGAGDAVAATTLFEWTRGTSVPEAFRRGLSVGGASCVSRDPLCNSCFSHEEAERLFPDVKLERIER